MFLKALYDTAPGVETLRKILAAYPDGFKRKVAVSAVDANTGDRVLMTDKNGGCDFTKSLCEEVAFEDFHKAVISSASVPGAFPPMNFNNHLFIDGMTAYNTDV